MSTSSLPYPPASQPPATISDLEHIIASALEGLRPAPLSENITVAFPYLLPKGLRIRVQLEEDGRKKRSTAAASNWSPETGEIVIYFERAESSSVQSISDPPTRSEMLAACMPPQGSNSFPASSNAPRRSPTVAERGSQAVLDAPTEPRSGAARFVTGTEMGRIADADLRKDDSQEVTSLQIRQCCQVLWEAEKAGKAFIALKWFRDNELMASGFEWAASLAQRQAVLTKAIEAGAVLTNPIPNPRAPQHPTTTIKLNRESEYAQAVPPRFQPIRAKGGASASEIILRDRGRF